MAHPTQKCTSRRGYPGGEVWLLPDDGIVDPVAVDIAANGTRPVRLTATEREHAAARILAAGGTAKDISVRLRIPGRAAAHLCARLAEKREEQAA